MSIRKIFEQQYMNQPPTPNQEFLRAYEARRKGEHAVVRLLVLTNKLNVFQRKFTITPVEWYVERFENRKKSERYKSRS